MYMVTIFASGKPIKDMEFSTLRGAMLYIKGLPDFRGYILRSPTDAVLERRESK